MIDSLAHAVKGLVATSRTWPASGVWTGGPIWWSEADVEDDGAAARRLADRAEVEHLVKQAVPVHLDLESRRLKNLCRLPHRHPDRVRHVYFLRAGGHVDGNGLARYEARARGGLLAGDRALALLAVVVRLLGQGPRALSR